MKLTEDQKLFTVQSLARFDSPQEVALALKEEFAIDVPRQQVAQYDATKKPTPPAKWVAIFNATRAESLKVTATIGMAHLPIRIRRLERMALRAEQRGNYELARQLIKQVAEEMGGAFTNRHKMELTGKDGAPIEIKSDDVRSRIARRIAGVASRIGSQTIQKEDQ